MALLQLYTDSHIPKALSAQLREREVDIVRCQELGFADESDLFHLEYATRRVGLSSQVTLIFSGYTAIGRKQADGMPASSSSIHRLHARVWKPSASL